VVAGSEIPGRSFGDPVMAQSSSPLTGGAVPEFYPPRDYWPAESVARFETACGEALD